MLRPIQRDTFFDDMNSLSFDEFSSKYLINSLITKIKKLIRATINSIRTKVRGGGPRNSKEYGILFKFDLDSKYYK